MKLVAQHRVLHLLCTLSSVATQGLLMVKRVANLRDVDLLVKQFYISTSTARQVTRRRNMS